MFKSNKLPTFKAAAKNVSNLAKKLPKPGRIVALFASPKTVAILKIGVAVVTLCQALDLYRDTERKIGFKK